MTTATPLAELDRDAGRRRIVALDVLRGFALGGILLVNIPWQIVTVDMSYGPSSGGIHPAAKLLELFVHGRFFPIFSVLFGAGFALFLDSAATRTQRPRLVLLRRLVFLAVLGIAHQQLHPGEALLPYAIFGVAVLLPASWLPRLLALPVAVLVLAGGVAFGGGMLLIPGMFLLGQAAVRLGVVDKLPGSGRVLGAVFVVAVVALVPLTIWQARTMTTPDGEMAATLAGLVGATAYGSGLLLALTTRLRTVLDRVLAPLGRMALTNYVSATLLAIAGSALLGLHHSTRYPAMIGMAAVILAAQAYLSHWWLAGHRYGPLEWLWRAATWWTWPNNRR